MRKPSFDQNTHVVNYNRSAMPPVKPEPIVYSPETASGSIELVPHIKSETTGHSPDVKSETIDYTPEIPQTKRLKTLSSESPSTSSKGKSKFVKEEDDDDDSLSQQQLDTCGVCLLEEGMSLRGFIDSCEHYFCFVCIMEWAKVESRCPICKRRFSTIRRPPKNGVFLSERIVDVPERNQVYYYNGNATVGPSDPYSEVKCSVCSRSSDDDLLLLCDLCDSAAHSYCVGLGATVPEGDWFCKDCTLSRDEHAKVETDTPSGNNNVYNNDCLSSSSNTVRFTRTDVSIHDIVRESRTHEPVTSCRATSVNQSESISQQSGTQSTVDRSNAPNARTLQRCLNVHARIQVLRENWEGFRGGSLNFSSLNQEPTSQKNPYNIDKAWKMMEIAAKALGNKSGNKSSVNKDAKFSIKKERLLKEESKERPINNYLLGSKKHDGAGTCVNNADNHRFQMLDKGKSMHGTMMNKQNHVECDLPSSRKINVSVHVKNGHYYCQNLSRKDCLGAASGSSGQSSSIAFDKCSVKKEIDAICKKGTKKDTQSDCGTREVENAKSEIQSLVKLNLKLLSRDKRLEVDVFKEVARHATHSIMAACGIEPPKARFRSFERLVCDHSETQKRLISTLMPTSCRECFFSFVKEVVTAIAFDTTSSLKV